MKFRWNLTPAIFLIDKIGIIFQEPIFWFPIKFQSFKKVLHWKLEKYENEHWKFIIILTGSEYFLRNWHIIRSKAITQYYSRTRRNQKNSFGQI